MATAKPKPDKTKDEAGVNWTDVPVSVEVKTEGHSFIEAIDMLDMKHILEALKRYTKHAYVAGNDYECGQLTKLTEALELRLKAS